MFVGFLSVLKKFGRTSEKFGQIILDDHSDSYVTHNSCIGFGRIARCSLRIIPMLFSVRSMLAEFGQIVGEFGQIARCSLGFLSMFDEDFTDAWQTSPDAC